MIRLSAEMKMENKKKKKSPSTLKTEKIEINTFFYEKKKKGAHPRVQKNDFFL